MIVFKRRMLWLIWLLIICFNVLPVLGEDNIKINYKRVKSLSKHIGREDERHLFQYENENIDAVQTNLVNKRQAEKKYQQMQSVKGTDQDSGGLSTGEIVGIIVACGVVAGGLIVFFVKRGKNQNVPVLLIRYKDQNYNKFSPFSHQDPDRKRFAKIFKSKDFSCNPQELNLNTNQSRAVAVMLGMAICDALGASTQFIPFKKQGHQIIKNGFSCIRNAIKQEKLRSRHGSVGIWTDDASMGIVMGYALILKNYLFDPILTRLMFHFWWNNGLGNGGRQHSIGLGGNISISMKEFQKNPTQPYTDKGNQDNNGNGSLMRLAPIPIAYHNDLEKAKQVAMLQSLTTHNGLQAKECARLMTEIIVKLISRKDDEYGKEVMIKACDEFKSQVKSVEYLAQGLQETRQMWVQNKKKSPNFEMWNREENDRNWNWRDENFQYSPTRLRQNSGYIGSYCMDGLAMALHTVYHTKSFKQCAIKNADMGGDCDTVGSIAGQIAGAIWGIDKQMLRLYSEMEDFRKERYEAFLMGYKLYNSRSASSNLPWAQHYLSGKSGQKASRKRTSFLSGQETVENEKQLLIEMKKY